VDFCPGLCNKDTPCTVPASPKSSAECRPMPVAWQQVISASDAVAETDVRDSFSVYNDFISEDEEQSLVSEVQPYLRRLKYEHDHWDDVRSCSSSSSFSSCCSSSCFSSISNVRVKFSPASDDSNMNITNPLGQCML